MINGALQIREMILKHFSIVTGFAESQAASGLYLLILRNAELFDTSVGYGW